MKPKIKSSKKIFKGRLLELEISKVLFPNNYCSTMEKIIHRGAVAVLPILNKNKLVLIRQYRPAIGKFIYEIPAGTIDKNETPIKCAKRELIEETGFAANRVTKISEFYTSPGYSTEFLHLYIAEGLHPTIINNEPDELISIKIVPLNKVLDLLLSGKIVDAKTLIGILVFLNRRHVFFNKCKK